MPLLRLQISGLYEFRDHLVSGSRVIKRRGVPHGLPNLGRSRSTPNKRNPKRGGKTRLEPQSETAIAGVAMGAASPPAGAAIGPPAMLAPRNSARSEYQRDGNNKQHAGCQHENLDGRVSYD
jgi:hypothetical protein